MTNMCKEAFGSYNHETAVDNGVTGATEVYGNDRGKIIFKKSLIFSWW